MRSAVLILLGTILAFGLVIDAQGPTTLPTANAAGTSPAPTPAPKPCVECVDDGAMDTCEGVAQGDDGATACKFQHGQCTEVGYCWVSSDYPKPTIGVVIH